MHVRGDWVAGIVGPRGVPAFPTRVARWNIRTGHVSVFTGLDTFAQQNVGVNASGTVVVATLPYGAVRVTLDGRVEQLPVPAGAEKKRRDAFAVVISDDGLIAGRVPNATTHLYSAVTWRCE